MQGRINIIKQKEDINKVTNPLLAIFSHKIVNKPIAVMIEIKKVTILTNARQSFTLSPYLSTR
ncbi:hypothetical protein NF27_CL00060 [Candidatus Jidaibacter acanthamoeba]|uniref:Uncharacterized protein n=1 Tax=Candidatus Jidaibacter acanthamoebae TaxID=86105 RepID=A0A0C1MUN6_9RICK|nr:hypothetical protein [Candidatus Jidaibacter acanthamoeba]KIE05807.1 hypothetical protein NF27_CL00060 [Candidatus Jidaibacter acanthamoeba]